MGIRLLVGFILQGKGEGGGGCWGGWRRGGRMGIVGGWCAVSGEGRCLLKCSGVCDRGEG